MRTLYTVKSNPVSGREDEFNAWYTDVHMAEVLRIPGFLSAQRFELASQQMQPDQSHNYMAVYEIDGDDISGVFEALRGASWLTLSDALDMSSVEISVFTPMTDTFNTD